MLPSSRPRVSNDNAFSESLFRTLEYPPNYPRKPFDTVDDATAWVEGFVPWYNDEHFHSGIGYVTPSSPQRVDLDTEQRVGTLWTAAPRERVRWAGGVDQELGMPRSNWRTSRPARGL